MTSPGQRSTFEVIFASFAILQKTSNFWILNNGINLCGYTIDLLKKYYGNYNYLDDFKGLEIQKSSA